MMIVATTRIRAMLGATALLAYWAGPRAVGAQRSVSASTASIVGIVSSRPSGEPLGFADATIEETGIATLATRDGVFHLRGIPSGNVTLRVRRLGFAPAVVRVALVDGREDTVKVALEPLALQLARIRVTDALCPGRGSERDTATLAILEQLRDNAERNGLLARESPFVSQMERTIGDEESSLGSSRIRVVRVDTTLVAGEHEWRYEPGRLVLPSDADDRLAREKMIVPQLIDFASQAFLDNHCFRYAGLSSVDGTRRIRVDFEPVKTLREPDVRGSMYLDTASYALVRTNLVMERPSPMHPTEETWEIRVDTWFREILPALPIVDRICTRTSVFSNARPSSRPRASVEWQRLVGFRFEPDSASDRSVLPTKAAPAVACR